MSDYVIDKLIGKGSFGKVYLIKNELTQFKRVAKFIKLSAFVDKNIYKNEIHILKKLSKKCFEHMICLDDYFTYTSNSGREYIVLITNYIDGISLREFIQNKQIYNLSYNDFLFIAYQLVYTLYKLHKKYKIVHKDLKPENIMINPKTLKLYLIDFGISCDSYKCYAGGTLSYMSPEMLAHYDNLKLLSFNQAKQSDVFSMGIILLELLGCQNYTGINKSQNIMNNITSFLQECPLHNEPIEYIIKNCILLNGDKRMKINNILHYLESFDAKILYNLRMSLMRERKKAITTSDNINELFLKLKQEKSKNKVIKNKDLKHKTIDRLTKYSIKNIEYIDNNFKRQDGGFDKNKAKYPRKWSKEYCLNTSCDKMGFSQKASCRYYKNCYKQI